LNQSHIQQRVGDGLRFQAISRLDHTRTEAASELLQAEQDGEWKHHEKSKDEVGTSRSQPSARIFPGPMTAAGILEHVDPDDFADPLVSTHGGSKVLQYRYGERWVGARRYHREPFYGGFSIRKDIVVKTGGVKAIDENTILKLRSKTCVRFVTTRRRGSTKTIVDRDHHSTTSGLFLLRM
jgi:hypothetical protein